MGKDASQYRPISKASSLGDYVLTPYRFENLDSVFSGFNGEAYEKLNHKDKSEAVNQALLKLIREAPDTFLLIAVVDFIDRIARENILINYSLTSFELWLNQFSGLSDAENYLLRAKVVGKNVPRDEYQALFPVGMGKIHPGSHYVTAHSSPDLDTTIASFWGWVDAFGARVSEGVHIWNVPGGAPQSSIEVAVLFHHIFGQSVFSHLAKTRTTLALSSLELMTQRGVIKQTTDQSSLAIDHERTQKAVILIDQKGYFLGDWRSFDVEGVRQVILSLNNCLRWFENNLHISLVSLFAQQTLTKGDMPAFCAGVFDVAIGESEPAKEFTDKQKRHVEGYLQKVLRVEKGLSATYSEFSLALKELGLTDFQECMDHVNALSDSEIFDASGNLVEDRPVIFHHLEEIIAQLDRAIQSVRLYTERLDVALNIKTQVFGYLPQVVSYRADVDEIKTKMGNYPYLTVTSTNERGEMIPLGVVRSRDLQQPILGTVTLRDFCNRDETKIPSYFEVISVIDHHKTVLNTSTTPVAYISDAQSSNSVVAQLAFSINDKFSTAGMNLSEIEAQIEQIRSDLSKPTNRRLLQRLLKKQHAALESEGKAHYVDPLREFVEYLHFLYAILDDTDLLTKVSRRDVEIVAELLNRLKTLMMGEETEIITFDDILPGSTFVEQAASRILKHPDMYSIYRKIYMAKEQLVEENFALCAEGQPSSIFVDTKLQNGCARIGQTKMFANNYPSFDQHAPKMRSIWAADSHDFFSDHREFDLHLHMISTIAGAEDLYSGTNGEYKHCDELWVWIPMTDQAIEHLKGFLNSFKDSPKIRGAQDQVEVEFIGDHGKELSKIFKESFLKAPQTLSKDSAAGYTLAVIRYPAATLNSRKAMISPYLPKQII